MSYPAEYLVFRSGSTIPSLWRFQRKTRHGSAVPARAAILTATENSPLSGSCRTLSSSDRSGPDGTQKIPYCRSWTSDLSVSALLQPNTLPTELSRDKSLGSSGLSEKGPEALPRPKTWSHLICEDRPTQIFTLPPSWGTSLAAPWWSCRTSCFCRYPLCASRRFRKSTAPDHQSGSWALAAAIFSATCPEMSWVAERMLTSRAAADILWWSCRRTIFVQRPAAWTSFSFLRAGVLLRLTATLLLRSLAFLA